MPEISKEFIVNDWRDQLNEAKRSDWKEPIYLVLRPILDRLARHALEPETIAEIKPDWVLFTRGFPFSTRCRWGKGQLSLKNRTVLVQGAGSGWDALAWVRFRPSRIVGVDLFGFDSWREVSDFARQRYNMRLEFYESPLDQTRFLADASVALCASYSVFEHVSDLDGMLRESWRVLEPDGLVYAYYGPLWYSPGGDHFSGRGGLRNAFNHVLMEPAEYSEYFHSHCEKVEDFQSGGRYVELDLFSRLRTRDYLAAFARNGFEVDGLVLEVSTEAIRFKREYPELFRRLQVRHPKCAHDDFLIKSHIVRLRKQRKAEHP